MFYLIDVEAERHQGDSEAALLGRLAGLRTHVQRLHSQLRAAAPERLIHCVDRYWILTYAASLTMLEWAFRGISLLEYK